MTKWLKNLLALGILSFLLWYLASHWGDIRVLLKLDVKQLLVMYLLCFMPTLIFARVVQKLMSVFKIKTTFWDMVRLHNTSILLNYVPMKFGTLFVANYLKRHYGFSYANFVTFFLYITFLMTATGAAIGLAVLVAIYRLAGYESKILAGVFVMTIIGSLFFLFVPLPVPRGQGRFSTTLREFLSGRREMSKNGKAIFVTTVFLAINFLLTALRIGIIYHSMGRDIHPAGYLVLGALGFVVLFIGLTPGSLGIRELVLGFGATVVGMPLQVGILAAMIDRAIILSYVFIAGGIFTVWLWCKSPADFSKQQDGPST